MHTHSLCWPTSVPRTVGTKPPRPYWHWVGGGPPPLDATTFPLLFPRKRSGHVTAVSSRPHLCDSSRRKFVAFRGSCDSIRPTQNSRTASLSEGPQATDIDCKVQCAMNCNVQTAGISVTGPLCLPRLPVSMFFRVPTGQSQVALGLCKACQLAPSSIHSTRIPGHSYKSVRLELDYSPVTPGAESDERKPSEF